MRKVYRVMLIIFGILSTIGGIGCSDEAKKHYNDGVAKADKKLAEQAGDERLKTSVDRALKLLYTIKGDIVVIPNLSCHLFQRNRV